MERCKVCKKTVVLEDRTVMSAFGKPLFICHKACAKVVQGGVATVGRIALAAGTAALQKKSPKTLKTFEALRTVLAQRNAAFGEPTVAHVEVK